MTLSLTINETLKWLSLLPILMQESFWGDTVVILSSLFPHLRPSLISLMVSVAVKHHRRQKGLAIAADVLGGAEGWRVSLSPSVLCCSVWFAVCSVSIRF